MLFVFIVWDYSLVIYRWKFPLFVVLLINQIMLKKKDLVLLSFVFFSTENGKKRSWIVEIFCRFDFIWLRIMKFHWIFFSALSSQHSQIVWMKKIQEIYLFPSQIFRRHVNCFNFSLYSKARDFKWELSQRIGIFSSGNANCRNILYVKCIVRRRKML